MSNSNHKLHSDHVLDHELLQFGIDLLGQARSPRINPVPLDAVADLPDSWPDEGRGERAAMERLAPVALDGTAQLYHPAYFAHMDPPTAPVSWIGAMWQVAANQNLLHPDAGPGARQLEARLIEWLAPEFGMHGGHLVPGSTIADFSAIWAARELRGISRVVASERAHLSAQKAADILGLTYESVPADRLHRMSMARRTALADTVVVLTAGTVATGAIDDLELDGAGWVHVDAAWGGPLRFCPTYRYLLDGVEKADSVGFSAHKWCYQPKGTAVVLFKDAEAAHGAMTYGGGYLTAPNIGLLGSAPANALPFMLSLLAWGRRGMSERIELGFRQIEALCELIKADERFELLAEPTTGIAVWRPVKADTVTVRGRLQDAWVSLTEIDGQMWLRSVAANLSADPARLLAQVIRALPD